MERANLWERISGANIDEELSASPGKAIIRYRDRSVKYISATNGGNEVNIEIQYRCGKKISWSTKNVKVVFSMLWGIPLSLDCRFIFAPQENGGVYCLSVEDGSVMWKTKSKAHFKQIMVNANETICCASGPHNIVVIDSTTGAEIQSKKITLDNQFTVLGKNKILVEATSTKWYVLHSETLETIEVIHKKDLNSPNEQELWKRIFKDWNYITEDDSKTD